MGVILLADDSPHAQRMGERILREEGFDVVSLADGETTRRRLNELDPDVVIADVFLPGCNAFELCRSIKAGRGYARVILTAGLLEPFDEAEAWRAGCDAILRKPFEASILLGTIGPLIQDAQVARGLFAAAAASKLAMVDGPLPAPVAAAKPDAERVQAAIAQALDAALPNLVKEITEKILVALGH